MTLLEGHAGLAGKTAVVLGGSGGVGRGVTLALAKSGIRIITGDINEDFNKAIVAEVEGLGGKITAVHVDVADVDALDKFYDRVEAEFDTLDILVNVAGAGVVRGPFMAQSREQDARDIRLNYSYVIDSMRRAVPLMRKTGTGGSIVNFTTIEAHRGAASYAVYAGANAALTNFSRAAALELAAEGIRVNLLAPDTTPAACTYASVGPELLAKMGSLGEDLWSQALNMYVPQKRVPTVEDLANSILFLVSDLSRAITGTTIHVDGGAIAALGFIDWPFGDGWGPAPLYETVKKLFQDKG